MWYLINGVNLIFGCKYIKYFSWTYSNRITKLSYFCFWGTEGSLPHRRDTPLDRDREKGGSESWAAKTTWKMQTFTSRELVILPLSHTRTKSNWIDTEYTVWARKYKYKCSDVTSFLFFFQNYSLRTFPVL